MRLTIKENAKQIIEKTGVPDILSVRQVREILGIGRVSVYQLIETGEITAFRMGRTYYIQKQSVQQYLERGDFV